MEPTTAAVRFGLELRRLRLQRGMSQRRLTREVGLTAHSNLVQYELGRRIPPADIVLAFERTLRDASGSLRRLRAEALDERARDLTAEPVNPAQPVPAVARGTIPAQLPATVAHFTGRAGQLRYLAALTSPPDGPDPSAVVVVAIAGTAGIGKTALAIHFAHRARERFPDGQLYVDLRGHSTSPPPSAAQVLAGFLPALGVPVEQIPAELDAAAGLYRSLLADRRVLVLLDNARDAAQVRPLLPAGPGCLALVTSRDRLTGLVARDGARRIVLDTLTAAEAQTLLTAILGADRVAAEPVAGAELARACAYLPLAIRIAAANLTNHSGQTIAGYLVGLSEGDRLAALDADGDGDAAVRAAFDLSYAALAPAARRMFRLLGLIPGPDVNADAAAALADLTPTAAAQLLDRLAAGHLIAEHPNGRYAFHDLLRLYASERTAAEDDQPTRTGAVQRLLDWYGHTADAAARLLYPEAIRLPTPGSRQPGTAAGFADHTAALAWLDAERPNLVAAVRHAAAHGPYPAAWLLADTLRFYFVLQIHVADWPGVAPAGSATEAGDDPGAPDAQPPHTDWPAVAAAGFAAAEAGGDLRAQAAAQLSLANWHHLVGYCRPALAHYDRALSLARRAGWRQCQASVLNNIAFLYQGCGHLRAAVANYTEALALERQAGRRSGQAACLGNLGAALRRLGRLAEAADHYARALVLTRQLGSRNREANALFNLGELALHLGAPDRALDNLTRALVIQREFGDRVSETNTMLAIAAVHRDAGDAATAHRLAVVAMALAREIGEPRTRAAALNTLGTICHRSGHDRQATGYHAQAWEFARRSSDWYAAVEALLGLAAAHQHRYPDAARTHASQALALARRGGYLMLEGNALTSLAAARLGIGHRRQAALLARRAVDTHRVTGHRLGEARAQLVLGHTLPPGTSASRAAWRRAVALFTAVRAPQARQTRTLLGGSTAEALLVDPGAPPGTPARLADSA